MIKYFLAIYAPDGAQHYDPETGRAYPYHLKLYRRYFDDYTAAMQALHQARENMPELYIDSCIR